MRYASVNGVRQEAEQKLRGTCPYCDRVVFAKCGQQRIWHWSHLGKLDVILGESPRRFGIASGRTSFPQIGGRSGRRSKWRMSCRRCQEDRGLVIEFQRSHITPDERISRENFYRNMVWVVDGTRLARDWPRFEQGYSARRQIIRPGFFITPYPALCFGKAWVNCRVPVFVDFAGTTPIAQLPDARRHPLWCMLPGRVDSYAVVFAHSRQDFVDQALHNRQVVPTEEIKQGVATFLRNELITSARQTSVLPQFWSKSRRRS